MVRKARHDGHLQVRGFRLGERRHAQSRWRDDFFSLWPDHIQFQRIGSYGVTAFVGDGSVETGTGGVTTSLLGWSYDASSSRQSK